MGDRTTIDVLVPAANAPTFQARGVPQTFEQYQPARAPSWLQDDLARAWNAEFGMAKDNLLERAAEAIRARLIEECAADAALRIGNERALEQFPSEPLSAYRTRVRKAWDSKPFDGTAHGTLEVLTIMGYTASTITERSGAALPGANWSEFTVQILEPSIPAGGWPAHLTLEVKERIVRAVLNRKPAHTRLRLITAGPNALEVYKQLKWGDELTPAPAKKWGYTNLNSNLNSNTKRKWGGGVTL